MLLFPFRLVWAKRHDVELNPNEVWKLSNQIWHQLICLLSNIDTRLSNRTLIECLLINDFALVKFNFFGLLNVHAHNTNVSTTRKWIKLIDYSYIHLMS